jgi:hypothetical protein
MRTAAFLAAAFATLLPASVRAQQIVSALSESVISINTNFKGTELTVFGAVTSPSRSRFPEQDIVVVIRGPTEAVSVHRKERVAGMWINKDALRFESVPGFYALASTRSLDNIGAHKAYAAHGIGYDALRFREHDKDNKEAKKDEEEEEEEEKEKGNKGNKGGKGDKGGKGNKENEEDKARAAELLEYRNAILRLREREGLFRQQENALDFIDRILFRAKFNLPASVPAGIYQVEVYLFKDGKLLSNQTSPLYIDQYGLERFLHRLAREQPFLYGLLAVILALSAGLGIASLFRDPIGH